MRHRHRAYALRFAVVSLLAFAGITQQAAAQSYTHYTERKLNSAEYVNFADDPVRSTGILRDLTGATVEYGWAGARSWSMSNGSGGRLFRQESSDVYAMANLGTGELKARSSITIGSSQSGSAANPAYGVVATHASASASFADTFRFAGGSGTPYLWGSDEQFQFRFAIDGQTSLAPGQAAPTDFSQPGQSYALVSLKLYRAGEGFAALAAFDAHIDTMDWGNPTDVDTLYQLNDAIVAATLGSHYWLVGDSLMTPNWYTDPNLTVAALDSSGAAVLDYSFEAGGDFEFVLSLETQVRIDLSYENMTNTIDFSNTLAAGFTAPEGVSIQSASGVFPGTVAAVPEPGTLVLALMGLSMLALGSRRRARMMPKT